MKFAKPSIAPLTELDDGVVDFRRLSQFMDNVSEGSQTNILTPLGRNSDPDDLLNQWIRILFEDEALLSPKLIEIEQQQKIKYGPRSLAKPWEDRKLGILSSYSSDKSKFNAPRPFGSGRLRPLSRDQAIDKTKNSTNSCLPHLVRKGLVKSLY